MKLTQSKKDENDIEFTAYFDKTGKIPFEVSILTAFLIYFGFTETRLVEEFSLNYYKDKTKFTSIVLSAIRDDSKVYADNLKEAQTKGFATIRFAIPINLQAQIISFLADAARNIGNRFEDAGHQSTSGVYDSIVGIGKNMKESGEDMLGGLGNIAEGTFGGMTSSIGSTKFNDSWTRAGVGVKQFGGGMFKGVIQTPLDAFLMFALKNISAFQTNSFFESAGRLLFPTEKTLLLSIFGNSVVYEAIRIKSGYAGLLNAGDDGGFTLINNNRPITIGNTIYMKNTDILDWDSVLVHETTHVWQHQNGGTDYMSEALFAQMLGGGYEFEKAILSNPPQTWFSLNPEQQAHLIEKAYSSGFLQNGIPNGRWTDPQTKIHRPDFEQYFISQNVLGQVRSGQGAT